MNYNAATGPLVPSAPLPITSDMDKMFTDLGLETFVAKTAEPSNGGSSTNTSSLSAIPTSMSSNSLSEKQRLAKQQEQSQRLQNTTELVAKPAMMTMGNNSSNNYKGTQKPIDLTSKLIDSNLNQIKSPTGNNNNSNTLSNWPGTGGMSNSNSGDSNWGAMTSAPSSNNGANWNANFSGMNSNSSHALQSPTQWTAVPAMSNNSNANGNSNNWSALDNLLPNKPQKTPMNQMMLGQGQQPLLMAHSQAPGGGGGTVSGNTGTNQLSQQDIMEFLG